MNLTGDLLNQGRLVGRDLVFITAENIHNLGGHITGGDVVVQAHTDLNNIGGTIEAAQSLFALAGGDLNVASATHANRNEQTGKSLQEVRSILRERGYTVAPNNPTIGGPVGEVWTKDLGNGFTAVVRADDGSGIANMADKLAHFHKEGMLTSFMKNGNGPTAFRFDDLGAKSFLENWTGNHIPSGSPYQSPHWPSSYYDITYPGMQ